MITHKQIPIIKLFRSLVLCHSELVSESQGGRGIKNLDPEPSSGWHLLVEIMKRRKE